MNKSAGQRLREDLDKALAHAGRESGRVLEFSEPELQLIDWAAEDADSGCGVAGSSTTRSSLGIGTRRFWSS